MREVGVYCGWSLLRVGVATPKNEKDAWFLIVHLRSTCGQPYLANDIVLGVFSGQRNGATFQGCSVESATKQQSAIFAPFLGWYPFWNCAIFAALASLS